MRRTDVEINVEELDPSVPCVCVGDRHDETREKRRQTDDPCNQGPPVEAIPEPVDRLGRANVEIFHHERALADDKIVCQHDTGEGCNEDPETSNDSQEDRSIRQILPWARCEAQDSHEIGTASNVNVAGNATCDIHASGNGVENNTVRPSSAWCGTLALAVREQALPDSELSTRTSGSCEEDGGASFGRVTIVLL